MYGYHTVMRLRKPPTPPPEADGVASLRSTYMYIHSTDSVPSKPDGRIARSRGEINCTLTHPKKKISSSMTKKQSLDDLHIIGVRIVDLTNGLIDF